MTIETEAGYTWTNGKHARILHDKNRQQFYAVDAADEVSGYPGTALNSGDTVDRWRPFSNQVTSPTDLSDTAEWTTSNLTVGSDGQTLDDGTASSTTHYVEQEFTFTAEEWVVGVRAERQSAAGVRIECNDGTDDFVVEVDFSDMTTGNDGTTVTEDSVTRLSNELYEIKLVFTPAAATGHIRIYTTDGSTETYTGANNTVKITRVAAHVSESTIALLGYGATSCTLMAIAAHNIGSGGQGEIAFSHDSNDDGSYTLIQTINGIENDSPLMLFFDAVSSKNWQLTVSRTVLPEIGVLRVGTPLTMERSFYSNYSPTRMARRTETLGNLSGSGGLLGRSKQRTVLTGSYSWSNLTYDWVRSNIDTPDGLIQAAEDEPIFIAWRPELTEDVDYVMQPTISQTPSTAGVRDLMTMAISGEVLAYE